MISEDWNRRLRQIAEGVVNLDEKFDPCFDGLNKKIDENTQDVLATINALVES